MLLPPSIPTHAQHTHTHRDCKSTALLCGFGDTPQIIFAWALNASGIHMPPDVGLRVGPVVGINYFVVQIHYGHLESKRK